MYTRLLQLGALLLLVVPQPSAAFEFDVWRSGMGLSQVLSTARDHDLPIAPAPIIHLEKGYNHAVASKGAGRHSAYKYQARLLNWPAAVTLQLTPYTRELHTVEVRWITPTATKTDRELLEDNLVEILSKKYGAFSRPLPGSLDAALLQRGVKQWSPSPTDRVLLERRLGGVLALRYVDLPLKDKAVREDEALRKKSAEEGRAVDGRRL
ncbi:MAG: hypothetical protein SCH98_18680 [Deferrisomatales bacterium]|nr:hypothetical protein [Deferrisomatales bacterium]